MPVITLEAGNMTKEKKAELAQKLTRTAADVLGLPKEAFIVFMKENSFDNIASGGVLLSDRK